MTPHARRATLLCLFLALGLPHLGVSRAAADDVYIVKPLSDLKLLEGKLTKEGPDYFLSEVESATCFGRATLEGDAGELVVLHSSEHSPRAIEVAIRANAAGIVRGRLVLANYNEKKYRYEPTSIRFEIKVPAESQSLAKQKFLEAKRDYYHRLLGANVPGGAWFRQQARETSKALGEKEDEAENNRNGGRSWRRGELGDTFELFSGGAAISENLQIDRLLPSAKQEADTVALDSLEGITVREFDWKPLVQGLKPQTDPLAARIPFDQHALFIPSFATMIAVSDEADSRSTPLVRAAEPRAEDSLLRQRYERQLCLPSSALSRLLGPHLVKSVAVTGSDPYLRTGSDVAVMFEAVSTAALRVVLEARVAAAGKAYPEAKAVHGEVDGTKYSGMVSPDRVICSYVATLGDAVVVTNSLAQLNRLVSVQQGKTKPLSSLDEYTFFRDRYRRGAADESALLVLSDATIRRWCGPQWRIANSRRIRAAAILSEEQADIMEPLVTGNVDPGSLVTYRPLLDAGKLSIARSGVRSSRYGTLGFSTPIVELDLTKVSQTEADLYQRWRDTYQQNWSNFFDPIAVRFFLDPQKLSVDVTVMPLIARSEYNEIMSVSKGAKLAPQAGDPHSDALAQVAVALNHDSPAVKQYANLFSMMTSRGRGGITDPFGWIGDSVTVYADNDPFWDEVSKAEKPEEFLEKNVHRLPVAVQAEVRSPLKLTLFLAAVRTYVEQSSPGMTVWDTKEYKGQSYVRVAPSEKAKAQQREVDKVALYYAPAGDMLLVTFNETLLKKALDRKALREAADKNGDKMVVVGPKWLGGNVAVHVDLRVVEVFERIVNDDYQRQVQVQSWSNLPILNEWHRLYPKQDPVALHERIWQRRLVCPGGGEYRWNDKWQTMESSVYGHPGEPKTGPNLSAALRGVSAADFGLTFEENGLRARAEFTRATPPAQKTK